MFGVVNLRARARSDVRVAGAEIFVGNLRPHCARRDEAFASRLRSLRARHRLSALGRERIAGDGPRGGTRFAISSSG